MRLLASCHALLCTVDRGLTLTDFFICTKDNRENVGHENSSDLGSGGREHALAWKCAQDPRVETVFVRRAMPALPPKPSARTWPGHPDNDQLVQFAKDKSIDLTIVGPEAPLVNGVVDAFRAAGLDLGPDAICRPTGRLQGLCQGLFGSP
jgi:hypothetical protein